MYRRGKKPSKLKIRRQLEEDNIIKNIRNLFILKRENEAIKAGIIRDIRNLFEKEDDHCEPIKIGNFGNNSYIEYESNENLLVEEYLNGIKI